ncbi:MAG: penicillin-binding transpeptidase domain-containing protein [Actinobacteria bacterium]|nr:penicillin-binding transpeptidase domain-containing protein [Actinomycetota bacterium]
MDKSLRRLFLIFTLMFLALIVRLTYVQVWAAPGLKVNPSNTRAIEEEMKVDRGAIISADGVELAVNHQQGEYFFREYPQGDLTSPWLGYNSLQYGRAGIERVYNEDLSGQSGILGLTNYWDQILNRPHRGADLKLTINMSVQKAAANALGNRKGAVVALDPRTGAVLAMVSYPRYDPNKLDDLWKQLNSDPDTPLLNRAAQGLYPPGSVFKMVVAGAALQENAVSPDTIFQDTGTVTAGGYVVRNYGGNVYGSHDFAQAFAKSINTTFAKVGVALGADTLARYAGDFGFGETPPWPLAGAKSVFPDPGTMDKAHVAQASFGQGEVLTTPLEMALVASAVANGGKIMKPYIVDQVLDYHQKVLEETHSQTWMQPLTPETAATLKQLMIGVVTGGTGTSAAISGVQVAGKTGTAEVENGEPHAWFAAFAPANDPQVVVAVLVENSGTGGSVAAPVARQVISAALGLQ